jgi:hypothetical protein
VLSWKQISNGVKLISFSINLLIFVKLVFLCCAVLRQALITEGEESSAGASASS